MNVWRVKITEGLHQKIYKVRCKGSLADGYKKVTQFAEQKEQELREQGHNPHVHLISCSYAFRPVGYPDRHGQLWCPYCRKWQIFYHTEGYDRCVGCNMTTEDFWIRKYNHLDTHRAKRGVKNEMD